VSLPGGEDLISGGGLGKSRISKEAAFRTCAQNGPLCMQRNAWVKRIKNLKLGLVCGGEIVHETKRKTLRRKPNSIYTTSSKGENWRENKKLGGA